MTIRLSAINFAGTARTLVAVGTLSEASMFLAMVAATPRSGLRSGSLGFFGGAVLAVAEVAVEPGVDCGGSLFGVDRKSTRLNSSHVKISYAVFCLKKKKNPPRLRCGIA